MGEPDFFISFNMTRSGSPNIKHNYLISLRASTGVIVSLHEDYSSYVEFIDNLKEHPFLEMLRPGSFLISLDDEIRYRPLTLSALANHVLQMKEKKE